MICGSAGQIRAHAKPTCVLDGAIRMTQRLGRESTSRGLVHVPRKKPDDLRRGLPDGSVHDKHISKEHRSNRCLDVAACLFGPGSYARVRRRLATKPNKAAPIKAIEPGSGALLSFWGVEQVFPLSVLSQFVAEIARTLNASIFWSSVPP